MHHPETPNSPPFAKDSGWVASYALNGARAIFGFYGYSKNAALCWLHVFDLAALPANGTEPTLPPIPVQPNSGVAIDWSEPRKFANGFVVALSTTEATLTISAAADLKVSVEDGRS